VQRNLQGDNQQQAAAAENVQPSAPELTVDEHESVPQTQAINAGTE
jgi:hypothetical protein